MFCFYRTDADFKTISTENFILLQALASDFLISLKVKTPIFSTYLHAFPLILGMRI